MKPSSRPYLPYLTAFTISLCLTIWLVFVLEIELIHNSFMIYQKEFFLEKKKMSDQEYDESALLEESGGENEIETETNEGQGDEENDPVSSTFNYFCISKWYLVFRTEL